MSQRPSLGAETEVALAAIDLSVDVSFAETPYPATVGSFQVITCTRNIQFAAAVNQNKFLPCGYNPAAQTIPAPATPGTLAFEGWDHAVENTAMGYNGVLCVARLITRVDDATVRTVYCNYYTLRITVNAPDGEQVGTVSGSGAFAYNV